MIVGDGIRFRAIDKEDLPRFVEWFNDPEVLQGVSMFLPMAMWEEEQWFEALSDRPQVERPVVEPRLPRAAVEPDPRQRHSLVLKIETARQGRLGRLALLLQAPVVIPGDDNFVLMWQRIQPVGEIGQFLQLPAAGQVPGMDQHITSRNSDLAMVTMRVTEGDNAHDEEP